MAIWPWISPENQGQDLGEFPHLKAWHERVTARPAIPAGNEVGKEFRPSLQDDSEEAREEKTILFNQPARR
jgi:glutathione S-transferase